MINSKLAVTLVLVLLAGCGREEPALETPEADVEVDTPAQEVVTSTPVVERPNTAPLSVEDIDRWKRGMAAELEAVLEAEADVKQSTSSEDTMNALMAANDMSTRDAGAKAAGVSNDRYQFIRSNFSAAAGYLSPLEQEMDVSQMPAQMIEQFEEGRAASLKQMGDKLPADVMETLSQQAAELRRQDMALTAARLRVAMAAR